MHIRPSVLRRQVQATAARARIDEDRLARYEAVLNQIKDVTNGVRVPNGTTKRIRRLVEQALQEG